MGIGCVARWYYFSDHFNMDTQGFPLLTEILIIKATLKMALQLGWQTVGFFSDLRICH